MFGELCRVVGIAASRHSIPFLCSAYRGPNWATSPAEQWRGDRGGLIAIVINSFIVIYFSILLMQIIGDEVD